jgi:phosphatidylserine decarboxylase
MKLDELLKRAPTPDHDGIYKCNPQGFLLDDAFEEFALPLVVPVPSEHESSKNALINVKAKFTPYTALRQQFWRQYMKQFDSDSSQSFSQIELIAMLDSLGSTLAQNTIDGFFHRFNVDPSATLTFDQVVFCLETELNKDEHSKRPLGASGTGTPMGLDLHAEPEPLGFTGNHSEKPLANATLEPSTMVPPEVPTLLDAAAAKGLGSKDVPLLSKDLPSRANSVDDLASSNSTGDAWERVINIKTCPLCHKPRLNNKSEVDIITHLAICASQDWSGLDNMMVGNFVTSQQAHRKWLGKFVSRGE